MVGENKKRILRIKNYTISESSDCFVIAEIGHNHQGSVEICKQLFKAAKECGVDAVKLQKRHNKKLYTKEFYNSVYNSENAFGPTYGRHREALEFDKSQYRELQDYAKKLDLIFFATAFDFESVDFLEDLSMPAFKIASADVVHLPLLRYIAKAGKPMIMSTGGARLDDVRRAQESIMSINPQLAILQCTASYPSDFSELDLHVIRSYHKYFPENIIGFSAHDNGIAMSVAAFVLGARIIEKHFTLNRVMKGTDHVFSLEPIGMRKLVRDLRRVKTALGDGVKKVYESEKKAIIKMQKKIVATKNLPKWHVLEINDIAFKSPGGGLHPYQVDELIGKKLKRTLKKDEAFILGDVL
ncbi:N-acetylneuraminate synthase family protein [Candidatus Gottesmanbacteria bacterium]|nr:N-acetylneuraminate synthase family protein [Candidatus Gottesmanbacteria bacterium]